MCTQSTYLPTYRKITETSKNVLVINFCSSRGCPSLGKGHDCEGKGLQAAAAVALWLIHFSRDPAHGEVGDCLSSVFRFNYR